MLVMEAEQFLKQLYWSASPPNLPSGHKACKEVELKGGKFSSGGFMPTNITSVPAATHCSSSLVCYVLSLVVFLGDITVGRIFI